MTRDRNHMVDASFAAVRAEPARATGVTETRTTWIPTF
jgi:hypothetical protein